MHNMQLFTIIFFKCFDNKLGPQLRRKIYLSVWESSHAGESSSSIFALHFEISLKE